MSYRHREYRPDGTYWVSLYRDDDTRTVTTYDETGAVTSTRLYTEAENAEADTAQALAAEQTARLDDLAARVAALEAWRASLAAAEPDAPDAPTWDQLQPPGWWLHNGLLSDGGKTWRNVSGTVITTPPSGFPDGGAPWVGRLFVEVAGDTDPDPDPEPEPGILAWAVGQQVEEGDKRTHNGRVWTAKLDHTTHAGWAPSAATYAVWTDSGPA